MTLKAVAYKSGMADSPVVEAAYPGPRVPPLPKLPDSVVLERDVQFGQAGDDPLLLDILRPKADSTSRGRQYCLFTAEAGTAATRNVALSPVAAVRRERASTSAPRPITAWRPSGALASADSTTARPPCAG